VTCEENRITTDVVDAALKLHKHFGSGVYENVYETALMYELKKRGLASRNQIPVHVVYDGISFDVGFKMDVLVNDLVILELKSVEKLERVHFKQLLTYLRLTGLRLGLLIKVGEAMLKKGLHRVANNLRLKLVLSPCLVRSNLCALASLREVFSSLILRLCSRFLRLPWGGSHLA
jgi:GxxExxY protein